MKSIFDQSGYDEIIARIEKLQPTSPRQWGKMSPAQMVEHCARAVEMAIGKEPVKQALPGIILSWIFKRGFLSDRPMPRNAPTGPSFIVKDEPDLDATKARLKASIGELCQLGATGTDGHIHGFFGKLSGAEWGISQYKHLDHHLRQFDC